MGPGLAASRSVALHRIARSLREFCALSSLLAPARSCQAPWMAWNLVLGFLAETPVEPVEQPFLDAGILGDPDIELALGHVDVLSQVAACNADSRRELQSPLSDWREALGRMTSSEIDQRLSFLHEHPLRERLQRSGFQCQLHSVPTRRPVLPKLAQHLHPRVARIPLTSGMDFIDPESIKIAFRVRNNDATLDLNPGTQEPSCFIKRVQLFANGQRCDDISEYGRCCFLYSLLKSSEWYKNRGITGFWELAGLVPAPVPAQSFKDVLMAPTLIGMFQAGKFLPPQLNLVLELEFAEPAAPRTTRSKTSACWRAR